MSGDRTDMGVSGVNHPLARLKAHTDARIALGRSGAGLPTAAHLDFAEAHARARDAVHAAFAADAIADAIEARDHAIVRVTSQATDRATYLRRPDLGRRLSDVSLGVLRRVGEGSAFDLVLILADGLSATAGNAYGAKLVNAIAEALPSDWRLAPVVIATGARVALSDPIGAALNAKIALMLVGERPGLSAADSLGAYLTFDPRPGRSNAERNCVSNIRDGGLKPDKAARKLAGLLVRSRDLGGSGTGLKDDVDDLIAGDVTPRLADR